VLLKEVPASQPALSGVVAVASLSPALSDVTVLSAGIEAVQLRSLQSKLNDDFKKKIN